MKNAIKLLIIFIGLISLSCTNDIQDTGTVIADTSLKLLTPTSGFNLVLDGAKLNSLATTFVWNDPANPTGSSVTYTVEAALAGTNFATTVVIGTTTDHFLDVTVGNLDTTAKSLGLPALIEGQLDVRVKDSNENSNYYTINVTPYQPKWSVIGSATPGTAWTTDTQMVFNPSTGNYSITLPLTVGEFKFRLDNSWTSNYGDDGNNLSLDSGGSNIPIATAGTYTIVANFTTKTYTITPVTNVWSIIGDAAIDWSTDVLMDYNATNNKYSLVVKLKSPGSFKFRLNQDWGTNYGDDGSNLSLDNGGANISVTTAGTYYIVADFVGHSYTITQL